MVSYINFPKHDRS